MRRLVLALPLAMGLVCGAYTIIYLVRWEWTRAIIAALFFVAVELVFVAMVVVDRLRAVEARLDDLAARPVPAEPVDRVDRVARGAIADAAPPARDHFAWLRDQTSRTSVFLPILLGAGVLASSLAWVVEHVARATLSPVRERHLAERLGVLRPPTGGFLEATLPASPPAHPVRRTLLVVGVLGLATGAALGTAASIDFVADRTQSRPDTRADGVETRIELQLYGAVVAHDAERAFEHLWSQCTGPAIFRFMELPEPEVEQGPEGRFRIAIPVDVGANAMDRLRGCLNDTTIDRVRGRVVNVETAPTS